MAPVSRRMLFSVFSSIICLIIALACLTTWCVGPSMTRYSLESSGGMVCPGAKYCPLMMIAAPANNSYMLCTLCQCSCTSCNQAP